MQESTFNLRGVFVIYTPSPVPLKVTGKRFAHATGPLVNNVKLRTFSCGSPGQIFSRQVLGWTAQRHIFCLLYLIVRILT